MFLTTLSEKFNNNQKATIKMTVFKLFIVFINIKSLLSERTPARITELSVIT